MKSEDKLERNNNNKTRDKLTTETKVDRFIPSAYEATLLKRMKQELGMAYAEKYAKITKQYVYVRVLMGKRDEETLSERDDEKMRKLFYDFDHVTFKMEL